MQHLDAWKQIIFAIKFINACSNSEYISIFVPMRLSYQLKVPLENNNLKGGITYVLISSIFCISVFFYCSGLIF